MATREMFDTKYLKEEAKQGIKEWQTYYKDWDCESFFNFFNPPQVPEAEEAIDEEEAKELQNQMEQDYDIGSTIRDKIIPHAVSWFTGEAVEEDEFDGLEEEDDDDEDDDEEMDDEDEEDDDDDDEDSRIGHSRGICTFSPHSKKIEEFPSTAITIGGEVITDCSHRISNSLLHSLNRVLFTWRSSDYRGLEPPIVPNLPSGQVLPFVGESSPWPRTERSDEEAKLSTKLCFSPCSRNTRLVATLIQKSQQDIDAIAGTRAEIDAENNQPTTFPNGEKDVHTYSSYYDAQNAIVDKRPVAMGQTTSQRSEKKGTP
ncbi:nucleosome assembly protein 1;2 [Tanacetum coccineum]|uniref:Nucleosome assembly protein 12 n=1 Tax=Tanacetum coccineum TaxID=301880 RepID=A0ABQ5AL34_9ASTR